jgi:hypothetical protein
MVYVFGYLVNWIKKKEECNMYAIIFINGEFNKIYSASQKQIGRIAKRYVNKVMRQPDISTSCIYYRDSFTSIDIRNWTILCKSDYEFNKRLNKKEVI